MKVGIIGGGQLAQMLALAAYPLGIETVCIERESDCPAGLVTQIVLGDYGDKDLLIDLAKQVDVITYEFENINTASWKDLAINTAIYPPIAALEIAQDRWLEKNFFQKVNIPTTNFYTIDSFNELESAIRKLSYPAILKTRRMGYDGKGQFVLRHENELELAFNQLGAKALILENLVKFDCELSMVAARSVAGEMRFYPLIENSHKNGILDVSMAPYRHEVLETKAQGYLYDIMSALNYVGVLTVEFFKVGDELIANEMAPRVHNSGHWTIEGAQTSQFENHLRAVLGLPLGSTAALGYAAMLNLVGHQPVLDDILKVPEAHCHFYGKEPRPQRKLGHVTLVANTPEELSANLSKLKQILKS